MYQPSIPISDRPEHPFAGQFGNYWAWRFYDALEALAATATPPEFQRRILAVHHTLADANFEEHADAWRAFVTGKIGVFRSPTIGPYLMGHPAGLGGPGTDQPSYREALGERPAAPFTRDVRSRLPEDLPPAADPVVPPGWVSEHAAVFDGIEVDIVYDPLRHEVLYTPADTNRSLTLQTDGWDRVASGRHRTAWIRERGTATRTALARLDAPPEKATKPGRQRGTTPTDGTPDRPASPAYEVGQPVRWKRRGRNWRYGRLADPPVERDGSLRVFEDGSGATRSLRPTDVERQVRGPRGGLKWVSCTPVEARASPQHGGADVAARPPVPAARTTQGFGR